ATMELMRPVVPANLMGLSSACVPAGRDDSTGLPIGVLITGPRLREDLCLEAAEAIEARLGVATPIGPVRGAASSLNCGSNDMQLPYHHRYPYSPIIDRPDYSWPDGKRLAVYLGLNIEHFAFGAGEGHLLTVAGAAPDPRTFAWRDYGNRVGVWRCLELF